MVGNLLDANETVIIESNFKDHSSDRYPIKRILRSACWVKYSAEDVLKYFNYFSKKIGFDISSKGDNVHEISNPVFWKKRRKINVLSSVSEFNHRVVKFQTLAVLCMCRCNNATCNMMFV